MNLSKEVKLVRCAAYKNTENTTDVEGAAVDLTNHDGVLFFAYMDKKTDGANKNVLQVYQKNNGTTVKLTAAVAECTVDAKVIAVDVYRPLAKHGSKLIAKLEIATASKTGDLYAVLYNGRIKPEQFADVITLAISPDGV